MGLTTKGDAAMKNEGTKMTPDTKPDKANDHKAFQKEVEDRKQQHTASEGKTNGAKGGNV